MSEDFADLYAQNRPQKPWFITYTSGNVSSAFNPATHMWHDVAIPLVSPEKCVLASNQGLLCYGSEFFAWPNLFVYNPLRRTWRLLPSMHFIKTIYTVGMCYDMSKRAYKIMVAGFFDDASSGRLATELYDSSTNIWTVGGTPWPSMSEAWRLCAGYTLWANGLFFCLTFSPWGLVSYSLEHGSWSRVPVQMPPEIVSPSLAECWGSLIMVGMFEEPGDTFSIRVWQLDFAKKVWNLVEKMPERLCREFISLLLPSRHFFSFGSGHMLLLVISEVSPALLFDLTDKSWSWIPNSPHLPDNDNWQLRGISFEPRLDTFV